MIVLGFIAGYCLHRFAGEWVEGKAVELYNWAKSKISG